MSAFPVITYEDGKVFCAATTSLTEVRRQLKLEPAQKFCYIERPAPKSILDEEQNNINNNTNLLVKPISLEIKPEQESSEKFAEKLLLVSHTNHNNINNNSGARGNGFFSSASTTGGPLPFVQIEVSPRGFYIPQEEFAFAGLTTSQRVFGCAATSVRLLTRQQYNVLFDQNELITKMKNGGEEIDVGRKMMISNRNNGLLLSTSPISATSGASSPTQNALTYAPLPRFFICAKIENWSGKKALSTRLFSSNNTSSSSSSSSSASSTSAEDDINFALAVLTEIALLISSRGSSNIIQLRSIYFDPSDKEKRDLYVVCEEGSTELTTDIATFSSKILPNMDQLFNNSKQQEFSPLLLDPKAGSSSKAVNAKILRNATGAGGSSGVAGVASEIYEGDLRTSSTAEAVELCFDASRQILDGIAHLHELGVVHGGVSPRNILASKINNHVQSFPVHSFWRFYLRDLGIIEAAACRYRSSDQLKNRKYQEKVEDSSTSSSDYYYGSASLNKKLVASSAALKLLFSTTDQHFFFYNPNYISDENLTLRYASPECLVGAPPTQASDIWSCGMILSELISSIFTSSEMPDERFDPIIERCGRGSLLMMNQHGNFSSSQKGNGKLLDKSELWERSTSGAGFPVSWVEARNRYSETAHVPFSAIFGEKAAMIVGGEKNNNNNNNNKTKSTVNPKLATIGEFYAGTLHSTTNQVLKSLTGEGPALPLISYNNSNNQQQEQEQSEIKRISKYASYSTQNIELSSSDHHHQMKQNDGTNKNIHNSLPVIRNTALHRYHHQENNSGGSVAEGLTTDIVVARVLSSTPGNPWKSNNHHHHQSPPNTNIDPFVLQMRREKQESQLEHNTVDKSLPDTQILSQQQQQQGDSALLSLDRAYATAETVLSSPQRSIYSSSSSSPNRSIAPLLGDFALYLAKRNVPQDVGQLLLSMMHFYPERRPSAVRCRRTPALLQTASNAKMPITFAPFDDGKNKDCNLVSSSASVRLHFAQTVDQSELHRKILAVLNSVKKRDSSTIQVEKLTELSHYLETLIVRGSIRNNFGRILEEILMSKSGMKKMETELEKATMKSKKEKEQQQQQDDGEDDEELAEENKLKRLLGQQEQQLQKLNQDRTGTSIFTADSVFASMSTLQSMMKILVCLANSRETK